MTYYDITQKLKDLTMTSSDWSWLSKHLIETGSAHVYGELVDAYKAREAGKDIVCDTDHGRCRCCEDGFKCTYYGFCSHQRKASRL